MKIKNKIIGIWGFGRVGQSAARFFEQRGAHILVWDDNPIQCSYNQASSFDEFLTRSDNILASPGIDTNNLRLQYPKKWLNELDVFQHYFKKKIIAITGSLGKTTVTTMLTQALAHCGWRVQSAGNIGLPCLDLINVQNQLDAAILEVSSFQLEHCKKFSPDLALWTNLYPNHLDRHGTMENYFNAKLPILLNQKRGSLALVDYRLEKKLVPLGVQSTITYLHQEGIKQNKAFVAQAIQLLTGQLYEPPLCTLEHRLEHVATINGVTFINDSKSTTIESTLAALCAMNASRIILFLGGLGKGVDREPLIQAISCHPHIIVICFGKEAGLLNALCTKYALTSYCCTNLDDAFELCKGILKENDCVLFSPSGSSYDLFKNYEVRGNIFKSKVMSYAQRC